MFAAFWNNPVWMRSVSGTLAALATLAIAAAGIYWLTQRSMFSIQLIRLEGERDPAAGAPLAAGLRHVNVATARAEALPRILNATRLNFFTVDLDTVRQAFENVAWVRRAQVSRVWPNRLLVTVEEHQVLGAWEATNDSGAEANAYVNAFVDTHGETFAVNPAEAEDDAGDDGLPEFSGPAGTEKTVVAHYREFSDRFARFELKPDRVSLSPRYAWSVHLLRVANADAAAPQPDGDGTPSPAQVAERPAAPPQSDPGLTVEFGREIDSRTLTRRLDRLLASYPLVTAKWSKPTLIDLRYPNGFALRAENLRLIDPDEKPGRKKPLAKSIAKPPAKSSEKPRTKPGVQPTAAPPARSIPPRLKT